jgi:hypothetical protein
MKNIRPLLRRFPLWLAVGLVAAGCNSRDDNPASTGGSVDELQLAREQAVGFLGTLNEMALSVDELAQGDLSSVGADFGVSQAPVFQGAPVLSRPAGLREDVQPVWDAGLGAWVYQEAASQVEGWNSGSYSVYILIRFLDATGSPQQEPDSTTATVSYDVDMELEAHTEENGDTFDISMSYDLGMTIGGLPEGPYSLDGSGAFDLSMSATSPGQSCDLDMAMSWAMDLNVPADGSCPTGTASATFTPYTMTANYAGGVCTWTIYEGATAIESGTETLLCGPPAS